MIALNASIAAGKVVVSGAGLVTFTGATFAFDGAALTAFKTAAGLRVGVDVQAYSANLATFAGIAPSANIQTLLAVADFATARATLGLEIGTNVQGYSDMLQAIGAGAGNVDLSGLTLTFPTGSTASLANSPGGNGAADQGKVMVFQTGGGSEAVTYIAYGGSTGISTTQADRYFQFLNSTFTGRIQAATLGANRIWTMPDGSGTVVLADGSGNIYVGAKARLSPFLNGCKLQVSLDGSTWEDAQNFQAS